MKVHVRDRQNGPLGLTRKNWLAARLLKHRILVSSKVRCKHTFVLKPKLADLLVYFVILTIWSVLGVVCPMSLLHFALFAILKFKNEMQPVLFY